MPKNFLISESEGAICDRLRRFRVDHVRLTQTIFAQVARLPRQDLANYEGRRAQLNYPAAYKILTTFLINPVWLATGNGPVDPGFHESIVNLPKPSKYGQRMPFSGVFDLDIKPSLSAQKSQWQPGQEPPGLFHCTSDLAGRLAAERGISTIVRRWIEVAPDDLLNPLLNHLVKAGESFLADKAPLDQQLIENARQRKQNLLLLRTHQLHQKNFENPIDSVSKSDNIYDMKAALPGLLKRLAKATEARGKKADLARWLGVPLSSVSAWLSGAKRPGGETTLKLLKWVEAAEAQTTPK